MNREQFLMQFIVSFMAARAAARVAEHEKQWNADPTRPCLPVPGIEPQDAEQALVRAKQAWEEFWRSGRSFL